MRSVGELVGSQTVWSVSPDQSVFEVAGALASKNIGALTVVSEERVVGIISERDIIGRVIAAGVDPKTTKAEAVMTKDPVVLDAAEAPARALDVMKKHNFRHVPVVREGKLVGMLSMRDLLQFQISTQEGELRVLSALPDREFE